MPSRYFNWKLAVVLLIAVVVLGATAFGLRQWRRANRAEQGLALGNKAYDEQKWEEAARQLGRYLAIESDDVPILLKYAEAQLKTRPLKRNNVQQAIVAYRTTLRAEENNVEAATKLATLYLSMNTPGEAELIAGRSLELTENIELKRILAVAMARQRKFDEAATKLKEIVSEHPEDIQAYESLGLLVEQRPEDFAETPVHWYDQAVQDNPSSALAYAVRAGFHIRRQNLTSAQADLDKAAGLDLSDSAARLRLAQGLIATNARDQAEKHLEALRQVDPTSETLWQVWAQLALRSQSEPKMVEVAEAGLKALSSQPWDFMPLATELLIGGGSLQRAEECISMLSQKDIQPAMVAFLRGLLAAKRELPYEAVRHWRQSIDLGNNSPQVRLALATTLSRLGDRPAALRQLRTLVSDMPNLFNAHLVMARESARAGNWTDVQQFARRAAELSPQSTEASLLLLQARMQLMAESDAKSPPEMWQNLEEGLLSLEKASDGAIEVQFLQFQAAMLRQDIPTARALVDKIKKNHEPQARIAVAEANLLIVQDKNDEAVKVLEDAVKEFPQSLILVRYLALLLNVEGNRDKCEAVVKDAIGRIEQPAAIRDAGLMLAQFYTEWGRTNDIYPMLNSLAEKLPDDILLKSRLLRCEVVTKDPAKAQMLVDEIKSIEGDEGKKWRYEQARVWFGTPGFQDRLSRIVSLLQENLLANPDDQQSRILLAATYERSGDRQTALSTYREALERTPRDVWIITPVVAALYRAQENDEAEEILNRAAEEELYDPQLQRLQLQSHLIRKDLDSASDILQDFVVSDPNDSSARLALAQLRISQKRYSEANELLEALTASEPNSLQVVAAQIRLNVEQKKSDEALRLCDRVIQQLGSASAYVLRARAYNMLGQPENAGRDLEHAAAIEPNNVAVWVAKSDFYANRQDVEKAGTDMEHALSLDPNNTAIRKGVISLLLAAESPEKTARAEDMIEKALESDSEDNELRLFKVRVMLAKGTADGLEDARQMLETVTEDQPRLTEAWVLLGEILLRQGQPGKAVDAALRGLVNKSDDKALLRLKARAEATRSPVLAIPTLQVLYELDQNDLDTALFMADVYITSGEPAKAVALLRKQMALCDDSNRRGCNLALAVALHKNGEKAEAQKEFDMLARSDPNDPALVIARARVLRDEKLWSEVARHTIDWCAKHPTDSRTPVTIAGELAETENAQAKKVSEDILAAVLKNDPGCAEAMTVLAIILQTTNRPAEAVELYRKILSLRPNEIISMNNLAWILCEEQGKHQEALELTEKALQIAPSYVDLIDTRGVILYRLGEFEKAAQDFATCVSLYPVGALARTASYFHLGRALAMAGQKDRAIQELNRALELDSRTGGLSKTDLAEAKRLVEELTRGG